MKDCFFSVVCFVAVVKFMNVLYLFHSTKYSPDGNLPISSMSISDL